MRGKQIGSGLTAVILAASLLAAVPVLTAAAHTVPLLPNEPTVAGRDLAGGGAAGKAATTGRPYAPPAPDWSRVRATAADAGVRVEPLGGAVFRVSSVERKRTTVTVDYSAARYAYGGDWAARLRLRTADGTDLPTVDNLRTGTASAQVDATPSGTVVALTAGTSGSTGDFSATPLQASSTWSVGGNSGDFSWSYPMRVPPSLGGPEPDVGLSYSSSSVDGRMVASNNQPSWIGEGFDYSPGFIERRYKSCKDDGGNGASAGTSSTDLCWGTDNAFLSLNGHSDELLKGSDGKWHPRKDDGSRIERKTGAAGQNPDNDAEYWVVTTTDGTQYWFGRNQLPGWSSGKPVTNSVWTVPVYGNKSGEPCNGTSCQQAWRWNLDYVVDPFGNTMSLWYNTESNKYARNRTTTDVVSYTRGGYLTRIDYGTRSTTAYGTAPMRVVFGTADRCVTSGCGTHNAANWPDTPWDLQCTGSPCLVVSPSFWITKRLSTVTTEVWTGSGTTYRSVESWTLTHTFPDPGDATRAGLWLAKISHKGLVGTAVTLPDVTFVGTQLPNRVDANDLSPAMNWWRIAHINTETGGSIDVTYSPQECVPGSKMPTSPQNNTLRCYPVIWRPDGASADITDYFNKYVVTRVAETDLALPSDARSPVVSTSYSYSTPAWHYADEDGLTPDKKQTWSVWRGYQKVTVTTGEGADQTQTETTYYRGMNGDKLPSGTRTATVPASEGSPVPDEDAFAGMARESLTRNGPGGPVIDATINDAWQSAATAQRTIDGVTVYSRFVRTGAMHTRVALDGGRGWRRTTESSTFDSLGMTIKQENTGDEAVAGDERCTLTTYVRNTSAWLMSYPSRVQQFGVDCAKAAGTGLTEADVISDEYTSYDGQARGAAPTKGGVTRTESLKAWPSTYLTTSQAQQDANGRDVKNWDVRGNLTTTAYTQPGGGPVTQTTTTNALGWVTTTTLEPAWGQPLSTTDPNGSVTTLGYDGLGRLINVWKPGRDPNSSPSITYAYTIRTSGASALTTSTLIANGGYVTSYTLYDSFLRPRQTQAPAAGTDGGRNITDTFYDTSGRQVQVDGPYHTTGNPSTTFFMPWAENTVPSRTKTVYDGAGRTTASIFYAKTAEKWRTTTVYGGDHTDVTPPAGAPPTSTTVDTYGNAVALRVGGQTTTYTYNRKGQLVKVTDPAGNHWDYTYDLLGRKITSHDPDQGTSTTTYNDAGDVISTRDARGEVLAYEYDTLGRKIAMHDDSVTGFTRAAWTYDTLAKGQLTSATRYASNGDAYIDAVTGYTPDYQPKGRKITIPGPTTELGGVYTYGYLYNSDGSLFATSLPRVGDVPQETLKQNYNTLGLPSSLVTTLSVDASDVYLVNGVNYTAFGEVALISRRWGTGIQVSTNFGYDESTRRLSEIKTIGQNGTQTIADVTFHQDPAGNVDRESEAVSHDTQCFTYDSQRRLTNAWTPSSGDCAAAPSTSGLGGPAPYWQSFTYDSLGDRLTSVDHKSTGNVSKTYTYPAAGANHPHALTSVQSGSSTASYTYDAAGNTLTRPGTTMTWDAEGHLATSADASGTTSYLYDASGNRLVVDDPTGKTLYLPGQELHYTKSTRAKTGVRYYSEAGQVVGQRTGAGITWLVSDHQGTAEVAIKESNGAVTIRRQTPFGESRGGTVAWPNDKGLVGGTLDKTGLTHLGAREYDPGIGRFVSVDPVLDVNQPQQMNGYSYADNSPITNSDPSGLCTTDACISHQNNWDDRDKPSGGGSKGGSSGGSGGGGCVTDACVSHHNNWDDRDKKPSKSHRHSGSGHGKANVYVPPASLFPASMVYVPPPPPPPKKPGFFHRSWNWIKDHRGMIATVVATGICFVPMVGWASCAAVQAGALAMRSWERADEGGGWSKTWQDDVVDAAVTGVSLGMGAAVRGAQSGRAGLGLRGAPRNYQNLTPKPQSGPLLRIRQGLYKPESRSSEIWQRQFPGGALDPGLLTIKGLTYIVPSQIVSHRDLLS